MTTAPAPPELRPRIAAPPAASCAALDRRTDTELMRLAAQGRRQALAKLYLRHGQMLLMIALRMLRNRSDAEDVLQEVFLYAWEKARSYDAGQSSVASWLMLITRSRSLDRIKMYRRRLRKETDADLDRVIESDEPAEESSADGFDRMLDLERWQYVLQELARLPEAQRRVLELYYFRGLSQKEVAEQTGAPVGTVKTRTLLGIRKLRRALARRLSAAN